MPAEIYDNGISTAVHIVMDRLVGKPDFGSSWASDKQLQVDAVPQAMRGVVKAAGGGAASVTSLQLENALWKAHDVIIGEDTSWGFHAPSSSLWRMLGMGGDGVLQPKEMQRAARKNAVASQLLAFLGSDDG